MPKPPCFLEFLHLVDVVLQAFALLGDDQHDVPVAVLDGRSHVAIRERLTDDHNVAGHKPAARPVKISNGCRCGVALVLVGVCPSHVYWPFVQVGN